MLARFCPVWVGSGPGPLPGRVFRGGCSWVERRLVGCSIRWWVVLLVSAGVESFRWWVGWLGTLLGPEGTGAGRWVGGFRALVGRCRGEPLLVSSGWCPGVEG